MGVPSLEQEDPTDFLKPKALCRRRRFASSRENHHSLKEVPEEQGRRFSLNTSSDFDAFFSDLKAMRFSGLHDDSFNNIKYIDGSFDMIKLPKSRETIYSITDFMQDIESLVSQDIDVFGNDSCSINDLADDFDCLVCQVTSCPLRGRHSLCQH